MPLSRIMPVKVFMALATLARARGDQSGGLAGGKTGRKDDAVLRTSASGRIGQAADPCRAHRRLSIAHAPLVVIEEIGC